MYEIAVSFPGELRSVPQQVATATSDLHQLDAQSAQLLVLDARDSLRHDAGNAETQRLRSGFNTKRARTAPIQSKAMARMKIGIQLPVAPFNTLPRGTSSDAVPFAV